VQKDAGQGEGKKTLKLMKRTKNKGKQGGTAMALNVYKDTGGLKRANRGAKAERKGTGGQATGSTSEEREVNSRQRKT